MTKLFSKKLLTGLSTLPAKQQGRVLQRLIAEKWLFKQTSLTKIPSWLDHFSPPVKNVPLIIDLLDTLPTGPEGTNAPLTPQSIALISEQFRPDSRQHKAFYTPFEQGKLLAQKTLIAWLMQNAGLTYDRAQQWLSIGPDRQDPLLSHRLCQLKICDPAAGAGGLLIPMWLSLARLAAQLDLSQQKNKLLLTIAQHNLYACDLSAQALADLRLRAALTLQSHQITPPSDFIPNCLAADALTTLFPPKQGFDLVLCNPPYLGQKNHRTVFEELRRHPRWQERITPKSDLIYLFFHLALDLLAPQGIAGFLTTAYWPQATAATELRKRLQRESVLLELFNFGNERIFERALGQHNLITILSRFQQQPAPVCHLGNEKTHIGCPQAQLYSGGHLGIQTEPMPGPIATLLKKMQAVHLSLVDVAQVSNGLMTGCDKAFILTAAEKNLLNATPTELNKLKPFFKNSDIYAYKPLLTPQYFLIDFFYPQDRDTDFSHYPRLREHLARFRKILLARKQNNNGIDKQLAAGKYWFGSVRRKMDFEQEKLVIAHRSKTNAFAYAPGAWYASSDVYFITHPKKPFSLWYLLALFNSAPYYAWLYFKGKRKGDLLELYAQPLKLLPVPQVTIVQQQQLEKLAQEMYQHSSEKLQQKIDSLVASILGFSQEEQLALYTWIKQIKLR